jgi:hypothetical protein
MAEWNGSQSLNDDVVKAECFSFDISLDLA